MPLGILIAALFLAFGFMHAGAASLADNPWPAAESDPGKGIEVAFASRSPFVLEDVGGHDFPKKSYPAVRTWLRAQAAK